MLNVGSERLMALADTGSTQPILSPQLVERVANRPLGKTVVRTPFGSREASKVELDRLEVSGREFKRATVIVEQRKSDQNDAIIGSSLLFSSNTILFTETGIHFDVDESTLSGCNYVPVVIDLTGNTYESPVAAVYFRLLINGSMQKVFFDTGLSDILVGASRSAGSDDRDGWSRPGLLYHPASRRLKWNWAYPNKGLIGIGDNHLSVDYFRYSSLDHEDADFFMGSGILQSYSILITPRRGRACFIKNK